MLLSSISSDVSDNPEFLDDLNILHGIGDLDSVVLDGPDLLDSLGVLDDSRNFR